MYGACYIKNLCQKSYVLSCLICHVMCYGACYVTYYVKVICSVMYNISCHVLWRMLCHILCQKYILCHVTCNQQPSMPSKFPFLPHPKPTIVNSILYTKPALMNQILTRFTFYFLQGWSFYSSSLTPLVVSRNISKQCICPIFNLDAEH